MTVKTLVKTWLDERKAKDEAKRLAILATVRDNITTGKVTPPQGWGLRGLGGSDD